MCVAGVHGSPTWESTYCTFPQNTDVLTIDGSVFHGYMKHTATWCHCHTVGTFPQILDWCTYYRIMAVCFCGMMMMYKVHSL